MDFDFLAADGTIIGRVRLVKPGRLARLLLLGMTRSVQVVTDSRESQILELRESARRSRMTVMDAVERTMATFTRKGSLRWEFVASTPSGSTICRFQNASGRRIGELPIDVVDSAGASVARIDPEPAGWPADNTKVERFTIRFHPRASNLERMVTSLIVPTKSALNRR